MIILNIIYVITVNDISLYNVTAPYNDTSINNDTSMINDTLYNDHHITITCLLDGQLRCLVTPFERPIRLVP